MDKKYLTYIFIALILVVLLIVIWYFFIDIKCDPENNGFTIKGKLNSKCNVLDPNSTNTPTDGSHSWMSDSIFPIKIWSWGSRVKAIQRILKITDDGKFGPLTESALYNKTGKKQLEKDEYLDFVNPISNGGGTNFDMLAKKLGTLGNNFNGGIQFPLMGKNEKYKFDFYTNGRFVLSEYSKTNYLYKGTYKDGGDIMIIDNGNTYDEGLFMNTKKILNDLGK